MKYCGVATLFKGVRVYVRSAMGMPGSETALEEVMCRVQGPLLQDGSVAKNADDLYCGGKTPRELLHNWKRVGPTSPTQVQPAFVCPQDHHQSQNYHYSRLDLECWNAVPFVLSLSP